MAKVPIEKKKADEQKDVERTEDRERFSPAVDIVEDEKELILKADMPGVAKEGLDIQVEEGVLTLHGKVGTPPADAVPVYAEYRIGDYYRAFTLSDEIDVEKIGAEMSNGVLTLHLPKADKVKTKKIAIKGA